MLEKSCQWWLIWYLLFFYHGGAEGQLQWVVKEKVTAYGQNLILFCPVENCCSEPAGWSVGDKTIIIDVKTFSNDPSVKYHGTYNTDGFGVVIRNLFEADLNVTYRCVYGFDQSTPKHLLHGDVFKENVPEKDKEIDTTATIVVAIVVIVVVIALIIIGIVAYCVCRSRIKKKRQKQTGTDEEMKNLNPSDSQMKNQLGTNEKMEVVYNSNNQMENQRDEVDGQSVTDQLVQTTPGDSNPRQISGGQVIVDSATFDFTFLYKLIRYILTLIPAPTCGLGNQPLPEHLNETDDIERIHYLRNVLPHNVELEIDDADFSTRRIDLSQAIDRLCKGSLSIDVESMRTESFDKCSKDIKKEQKQIQEKVMELNQKVTECVIEIAYIRKKIYDINDRHRSLHIRSKLSDKVVLYVASQLGSDWTQVVLLLGIKQSEIEQIKMDNQGRSIEQITVALFKWKNRQNNRPKDTIKQLIEALEFPGRQDIIDNLREKYEIY